jgi:hypothetical protein
LEPAREPDRIRELRSLVEEALGPNFDHEKFSALIEVQGELWMTQDQLTKRFDSGAISAQEYWREVNTALRTAMERNRGILGLSDFYTVFGPAGDQPEAIGDFETFIATSAGRDLEGHR